MKTLLITIWAILLCCLLPIQVNAQHPVFKNYTTEDGLPSPEVHYALQDTAGIMWFATDNGLSRFNGYEFKNYGSEQGLKHQVLTYLQLDSKGTLWIAGLNGHLYFMQGDTILPFEQNYIIDSLNNQQALYFYINKKTNEKYIATYYDGIFNFSEEGKFKQYQSKNPFGGTIAKKVGEIWVIGSTIIPIENRKKYNTLFFEKGRHNPFEIINPKQQLIKGYTQDTNIDANRWMISINQRNYVKEEDNIYLLQSDTLVLEGKTNPFLREKTFEKLQNGNIIAGGAKGVGLLRYENFQSFLSNDYDELMPNISVSDVFIDAEGGFWVTTIENGIFYCRDIEQKIFDKQYGFSTDNVMAVTFKNENEVFAGLRNGDGYHLNLKSNELKLITPILNREIIYDLFYDKKFKTLWTASGPLAYLKDSVWKRIPFYNQYDEVMVYRGAKKINIDNNGRIWTSASNSFGSVNMESKTVEVSAENLNLRGRCFVSSKLSTGKVWLGYPKGLFEFKNNTLHRPEPFFPEFKTRVDDLDELADSTLVIATKGAGVLLWKENDLVQIRKRDGLTSNNIENVHVDNQGHIWVGTLEGLNRIEFSDSSYSIKKFTIAHGLPSNEINQVRSNGEQVWVATTKGLLKWREPQISNTNPLPVVEYITVNNEKRDLKNTDKFKHDGNNLVFNFLTINYRAAGNILYRFRLNKEAWTTTHSRSVNYANLASDDYLFEVQSQTEDGHWSESTEYNFSIATPWWATWWFRTLAVLSFLGLVFLFYKNQTNQLKKESQLQKEIGELERAALSAQMNPHFIFNCLNSIQNFIVKNETEQAVNYLSKFAKLIRRVLKSSAEGKILLEEEIDFLKNYLSLEQLRFKEKFDFKIEIDPKLDLVDVEIPALLIQPFVENAIMHGMKDKQSGGEIIVSFEDRNESVKISVTDNGSGIYQNEIQPKLHQSMGLGITSRRLEIINAENPIHIAEIKNADEKIIGTKINLTIKKLI